MLYKYRSLTNLRRFIEILINKELYAAKLEELNDPMEGVFRYNNSNSVSVKDMIKMKLKSYICSLSETYNNGLMWSHYADSHKGCCIGVEVEESDGWKKIGVDYRDEKIQINEKLKVDDILKIKSSDWSYEKEVRYVQQCEERPRLKVKIEEIYLGEKLDNLDVEFYTRLINTLCPNIRVEQINKDDIDFGYKTNQP